MTDQRGSKLVVHDLSLQGIVHTDEHCVCRQGTVVLNRPKQGETCRSCGGATIPTGTCTTCVECGTTGGCG